MSYLVFVPNFKSLSQVVSEQSLTETIAREKEKWINKETDKQYVADSLMHDTTCRHTFFLPNFKILNEVVSEKSLMEKVCRHTDKLTSIQKR